MISDDNAVILLVFSVIIALPCATLFFKTRSRTSQRIGNALFLVSLCGVLYAAFFLEIFLAITVYWTFCLVTAGLILALCGIVYYSQRIRTPIALGAITILSIFVCHFLDTGPKKPFMRFYSTLEHGMTSDEVIARLDREYPPDSSYPRPTIRHSEDGG
ncbi:MAG: hypothetical protein KJ060_04220, partial [Candidatus Hydrogenedentes bacterium]|nr:hypothetical protein [Candidatus Hydrogenedentota bacterium]